ncbi:hypothetical protein [Flavobacterium sp.]|uniref:hypothetical protein n=1 Tax=Flavobacterium sp. TaxID=239 RepID=UPI0039E29C4C
MKRFIIIIALIYFTYGFSQINPGDGGNNTINVSEFNYSVSPKAAEFVRYGNTPVNLSSGQLKHSIPLYTVSTDGFSLPIVLSYSYSGLQLERMPSEVGLGWSLINGGAITREVRGLPDEHPNGLNGPNSKINLINNLIFGSTVFTNTLIQNFSNGLWDSEPDKYNVNIADVNFSFYYYDDNFVFEDLVNYDVIAIKENNRINKFILKDDKANTYHFEAKELTNLTGGMITMEMMPQYISAWQITKIVTRNGREINFNYQNETFIKYNYTESLKISAAPVEVFSSNSTHNFDVFFDCGLTYFQESRRIISHDKRSLSSTTVRKKLISIQNPELYIQFIYTPNSSQFEIPKIQSIVVNSMFNNGTTPTMGLISDIRNIVFDNANGFLNLLKINNIEEYKFEYINGNVGSFNSNLTLPVNQDYWGYANGANNGNTAMARLGAIRAPNFEAARAGALHKITYPTGGHTKIFYEPNSISLSEIPEDEGFNTSFNKRISLKLGPDSNSNGFNQCPLASSGNGIYQKTYTKTFNQVTYATISHSYSSTNSSSRIYISLKHNGNENGNYVQEAINMRAEYGYNSDYIPTIAPKLGVGSPLVCVNGGSTGGLPQDWHSTPDVTLPQGYINYGSGSSGGVIKILPGTYTITLQTNRPDTKIEFDILFLETNDPIPQNNAYNIIRGGIRVSKTIDYQDDENVATSKYYKYVKEDGSSSGIELSKLQKKHEITMEERKPFPDQYNTQCPCVGFIAVYKFIFQIHNYSHRPFNPIITNDNNPIYYTRVEVMEEKNIICELDNFGNCIENGDLVEVNPDFPLVEPYEDGENEDNQPIEYEIGNNSYLSQSETNYLYNFPEGKNVYYFHLPNTNEQLYPFVPQPNNDFLGKEIKSETYKFSGDNQNFTYDKIREEINTYEKLESLNSNYSAQINVVGMKLFQNFEYLIPNYGHCVLTNPSYTEGSVVPHGYIIDYPSKVVLTKKVVNEIDLGISKSIEYEYDGLIQLSKIKTTDSQHQNLETEIQYYYSTDDQILALESAELSLEEINWVSLPLKTITRLNNEVISTQRNSIGDFSGKNQIKKIYSSKGANDLEKRVEYLKYDEFGNPVELINLDGIKTVYVWGYNKTLPIAKVENASYQQVQPYINSLQSISNNQSEDNLLAALNSLRNELPEAMVTTYVHKPYVGVSRITSPNGQTMYYHYDELQRLVKVVDQYGAILSENEYKFRTQN